MGLLVAALVHPASIQDRDGAAPLLRLICRVFPWRRHIFADGAYADCKPKTGRARIGKWTIEIVTRSDLAKGFQVLQRRWMVEFTFAWFGRDRRLAKDFEATIASAEAWIVIASIRLLSRRLART